MPAGEDDRVRWLGAVEGFYGEPLTPATRSALVSWLGSEGFNCYAYAPKHDPFHRDRWREPYPQPDREQFAALVELGDASGVAVAMAISPGLDWRDGDESALVAKLTSFRELGARVLAIAFDDVPPGGAELGAVHGRAVAAAVEALGDDIRWFTCPTDYATPVVTPYLEAFAATVPATVDIMWTGPSIVSPTVTGDDVRRFAGQLGRRPLFAENYPVNDGGMEGVLHLGPYPERSPDVPDETAGVFCNFMRHAVASRVGLSVAARFWRDPHRDRDAVWREVIAAHPGLEPLALACSMWIGRPDPAAELVEWLDAALATAGADTRLRDHLRRGCRSGLAPELAAELEPWLDQWDRQAHVMQWALELLATPPDRQAEMAMTVHALWQRARQRQEEVFGVRWAAYPVTTWDGVAHVRPESVILGDNLADRLCKAALGIAASYMPR